MLRRIREVATLAASRLGLVFRLRTRYTRALEEEIARLRGENRALVNSIQGVAGIPPMRAAAPRSSNDETFVGATLGSPGRGEPRPHENRIAGRDDGSYAVGAALRRPPLIRGNSEQNTASLTPRAAAQLSRHSSLACPERSRRATRHCSSRRRSWQQIGRALEIEDARAARRERESDTDTFPAPRTVVPRV